MYGSGPERKLVHAIPVVGDPCLGSWPRTPLSGVAPHRGTTWSGPAAYFIQGTSLSTSKIRERVRGSDCVSTSYKQQTAQLWNSLCHSSRIHIPITSTYRRNLHSLALPLDSLLVVGHLVPAFKGP